MTQTKQPEVILQVNLLKEMIDGVAVYYYDEPIIVEAVRQVTIKDTVYDKYTAGDEPEEKALLIGLPLASKTDKWVDKQTKQQKEFTYWAKIGNFGKGIPIAEDMNLLVRANPPQSSYKATANSNFAL